MRGGGLGCIGLGAFLTTLSASLAASAQESSDLANTDRSYALDYRAAAGCLSAERVREAIAARAVGATSTDAAQASIRFTLELRANGDSSLWVDLREGSFRRDFHAESCVEAVESMAVIAAMVIDTAPAERRALTAVAATEVAAASESETSPPVAELLPLPDALPRPLPAALLPTAPDRRFLQPKAVEPVGWGWAVAAGTAFETAVAPSPPLGVTAALQTWRALGDWWTPSIRLSVLSTVSSAARAVDADADGSFRLLAGRLALCPFRRTWRSALHAEVCADFEVGSLHAQGEGQVRNPQAQTMLWLAPGLSLRAQLDLGARWGVEMVAGGKRLLRRDQFVFYPSSPIYDVPATSFDLGAGVVWQFL